MRTFTTAGSLLAQRSDLHLPRKLWHLGMGLMIVAIYLSGMTRSTAVVCLALALALDLVMETARLRHPRLNERVIRLWGPLMRASERDRYSGTPFYLAATLLAVALFPPPIAVLGILYLACGDPIASLVGIRYGALGPRWKSGKTVVGTAAGVFACMAVTLVFLTSSGGYGLSPIQTGWMAIVGGLAGGLAELIPWEVDDNLTIPLVSGFVLWLAFMGMGL